MPQKMTGSGLAEPSGIKRGFPYFGRSLSCASPAYASRGDKRRWVMEKRRLDEAELLEEVKRVYEAESNALAGTNLTKRALFMAMAETLNREGVLSHKGEEWNWQKIDAYVRRNQVGSPDAGVVS
jgi:hypothetical protein